MYKMLVTDASQTVDGLLFISGHPWFSSSENLDELFDAGKGSPEKSMSARPWTAYIVRRSIINFTPA